MANDIAAQSSTENTYALQNYAIAGVLLLRLVPAILLAWGIAWFVGFMLLFAGAMTLVVLSSDLVLTVVGWEVMGWCSYLLIGHHSAKAAARRAATKALVVTDRSVVPSSRQTWVAVPVASTGTADCAATVTLRPEVSPSAFVKSMAYP